MAYNPNMEEEQISAVEAAKKEGKKIASNAINFKIGNKGKSKGNEKINLSLPTATQFNFAPFFSSYILKKRRK